MKAAPSSRGKCGSFGICCKLSESTKHSGGVTIPPLCCETEFLFAAMIWVLWRPTWKWVRQVSGGRMRDSIKLRSRPRRAGDEQGSTGALHQIGSNPYPLPIKNAIRMGTAVIRGWMRDSIKLRSRPRRAGDEQGSTGALHQIGSNPYPLPIKNAIRMGTAVIRGWMRDSIKLRSCRRPAGGKVLSQNDLKES